MSGYPGGAVSRRNRGVYRFNIPSAETKGRFEIVIETNGLDSLQDADLQVAFDAVRFQHGETDILVSLNQHEYLNPDQVKAKFSSRKQKLSVSWPPLTTVEELEETDETPRGRKTPKYRK